MKAAIGTALPGATGLRGRRQDPGERGGQALALGAPVPWAPRFQTSSLQDRERTLFCPATRSVALRQGTSSRPMHQEGVLYFISFSCIVSSHTWLVAAGPASTANSSGPPRHSSRREAQAQRRVVPCLSGGPGAAPEPRARLTGTGLPGRRERESELSTGRGGRACRAHPCAVQYGHECHGPFKCDQNSEFTSTVALATCQAHQGLRGS